MATHPGTIQGWVLTAPRLPTRAIPKAEWRLCLERVLGGRRQASVPGVFCYTEAFQRVSGAAECASLALQGRHRTQRGLLSHTGPFWEEKPLSRSRAAQQAVHAPLPTTAPVQRGPIQACLPGLARTHDSMCCDISCRGQRLALGRINACFCLLSYFIYILKTAYQGKKIALQKKKKKCLASGRHRGERLGWHWGPRPAMQSGPKPAWALAQPSCGSGEWGSRGDFQKLQSWPLWIS